MKTLSVAALLILLVPFAKGQTQKARFASINQAGLISGAKGEAWTLQTINGIQKNTWFVGAGTGLDFYGERSVPLFLDIRKDFTNNRNTPFIYADGGANFVWLTALQKQEKQFPKTSPGAFYDVGFGWKLSGKSKRAVLFSAGYSFKQVKEKVLTTWYTQNQSFETSYLRYNYLYRRLVIKFAIEL